VPGAVNLAEGLQHGFKRILVDTDFAAAFDRQDDLVFFQRTDGA